MENWGINQTNSDYTAKKSLTLEITWLSKRKPLLVTERKEKAMYEVPHYVAQNQVTLLCIKTKPNYSIHGKITY